MSAAPTPESVAVVQADREAAASLVEWLTEAQRQWGDATVWFSAGAPQSFRAGAFDHHEFVQSHARHRISATPPITPTEEKLAAALADRNAVFEALKQAHSWIGVVADCDMDEIVADGGITAAMVVRQEAQEQQRRARRAIADSIAAYSALPSAEAKGEASCG